MKILEVKNLSLSFHSNFGKNQVLNNISFSLKKSETLGIVGESGSGKTLTAMSIMRLLPGNAVVESGEIYYFSDEKTLDILKINSQELLNLRGNNISMIFQEPMTSLNPSLTCGYQVTEMLTKHLKLSAKEAKNKTLQLFNEVKLPNPTRIFTSYPHQISGGQKQRVMIAMAIALNPSILIADEPTTALDVTIQKSIIELLKSIQEKYKISIIFISHDLGVISQIADNILVMYKGEIVEYGETRKILKLPEHEYTKALLKCRPTLQTPKGRLPVLSDFLNQQKTQKLISVPNDNATRVSQKAILSVNNLYKDFIIKRNFWGKAVKTHQAIHNFSFTVFKGETLGLVGESGCGKTTLGRVISMLTESSSGTVEYNGTPLNILSAKEIILFRKNIQFIFQDPYSSLNPKFTIGDTLLEPLTVHKLYKNKKERIEKVYEILEKVRLEKQSFYKYPHEFSGGQRQRIVIARALILQPELIICDESVSALDVSIQAEILNLLNDIKAEFNLTYIFISHDLSVVKYMSDRIMVMSEGKLIEINKAEDLYKSPASEYTRSLINAIPQIMD